MTMDKRVVIRFIFRIFIFSFITFIFLGRLSATDNPTFDFSSERNLYYSNKFKHLYDERKHDSLALLMRMWEAETGMHEALFRAHSLYLISINDFPGHLVHHDLLEHAIAWEIRYDLMYSKEKNKDDYFQTHPSYFSFIPIGSEFDQFTINAARRQLTRLPENSLAYAYAKLYAGDTEEFFTMISEGKYSGTALDEEYRQKLKELYKMPETHLAINTSAWLPRGNLTAIGYKPSIGVEIGRWFPKFKLDMSFDIRFGKSANSIDIALTDTIMLAVDNFIGARAALKGSFNIYKKQSSHIDLSFEGGYEWFEMAKSGQDRRGRSFATPAAGAGVIYRYFFPNRFNIGITANYNMLWFENPGGTALDGSAFTLGLQFGFTENPRKKIGLNRFGINYW